MFNIMNRIVFVFILSLFSIASYPQVFKGLTSFKDAIEWEGQRFLMDEIYNISSESIDTLRIEKILRDVDSNDGFMIVVTSYTFNQKTGVVLTSFNSILMIQNIIFVTYIWIQMSLTNLIKLFFFLDQKALMVVISV